MISLKEIKAAFIVTTYGLRYQICLVLVPPASGVELGLPGIMVWTAFRPWKGTL